MKRLMIMTMLTTILCLSVSSLGKTEITNTPSKSTPLIDWLALNTMQERWDLVRSYYKKYDVITYAEVKEVKQLGVKRELILKPYRMYKGGDALHLEPITVILYGTKKYTKGEFYLFYLNRINDGKIWMGDDNRVIPDYIAGAEIMFLMDKVLTLDIGGNTAMECPDYIDENGKLINTGQNPPDFQYYITNVKLLHSIITPTIRSCILILEDLSTKQKFAARFGVRDILERPSQCPSVIGTKYKAYTGVPIDNKRAFIKDISYLCIK